VATSKVSPKQESAVTNLNTDKNLKAKLSQIQIMQLTASRADHEVEGGQNGKKKSESKLQLEV
jgi:hypothetical protein